MLDGPISFHHHPAVITEHPNESIFDSGCKLLVNPVNCVGVMGAGLAKQFRKRFPHTNYRYQTLCEKGMFIPGSFIVLQEETVFVGCMATKDHWQDKSKMDWILTGLEKLRRFIQIQRPPSVALPAVGCGRGGLPWEDVKRAIYAALSESRADVKIYPPQ